jgi:hypothetical protein
VRGQLQDVVRQQLPVGDDHDHVGGRSDERLEAGSAGDPVDLCDRYAHAACGLGDRRARDR